MIETVSGFTAWDYTLVAVVLGSVLLGLLKGLVRTIFGLAAWFVAALVALFAGPALMVSLQVSLPLPFFMFLVFLVVFLVTRIAGTLIARGLAWVGLGGVDRVLGALFGAVRAALIMIVIVLAAFMLDWHREPAWEKAWSKPLLDDILGRFGYLLPEIMPAARRVLDVQFPVHIRSYS
jgi:membrane protein required for colicin V production